MEAIDACEDRNKFSQLCDALRVDQPEWSEFATLEDCLADRLAAQILTSWFWY